MRVLYVEDTLLNLCLIERIARMGSHEVINYVYAEKALENFECDDPHLVLVDLRLEGDMTGIEFIERIRANEFTGPIIVITAQGSDEVRERCMAAGATEFFSKPLQVRDMVSMLNRYEKPDAPPKSIHPAAKTLPVKPKPLTAALNETNGMTGTTETKPRAMEADTEPTRPVNLELPDKPAQSGAAASQPG